MIVVVGGVEDRTRTGWYPLAEDTGAAVVGVEEVNSGVMVSQQRAG
jgi:hypothetical protein